MVELNQAKPLYQIVADSVLEKIESGEYASGQRLPSESELCKIYGVGRNTIRHALSKLADFEVVRTIQGVGSFVESNRFTKTVNSLLGFSQEMSQHEREVSSIVLESELISASSFLARHLRLQLGAEVVFLNRVRLLGGEPIAIERAYLPHHLCRGILVHDFSSESLYRVLAEEYNMKPDHAEQEILAELATDQVAKLLELEQPAVVLVFHRETLTRDNQVIEYVDSEFRADRVQIFTHLKANALNQPFLFERYPVDTR